MFSISGHQEDFYRGILQWQQGGVPNSNSLKKLILARLLPQFELYVGRTGVT